MEIIHFLVHHNFLLLFCPKWLPEEGIQKRNLTLPAREPCRSTCRREPHTILWHNLHLRKVIHTKKPFTQSQFILITSTGPLAKSQPPDPCHYERILFTAHLIRYNFTQGISGRFSQGVFQYFCHMCFLFRFITFASSIPANFPSGLALPSFDAHLRPYRRLLSPLRVRRLRRRGRRHGGGVGGSLKN